MKTILNKLRHSRAGAALVEYAILVGVIAVLCIFAVLLMGHEVRGIFVTVDDTLASNMTYEDVAEAAQSGSDPIVMNWTNEADYPDGASCFPVPPGGTYDPTYTCFIVDASLNEMNDFSPIDENVTVRVVDGDGGGHPLIVIGDEGGTVILETPAGEEISFQGTDDTAGYNVIATNYTCEDVDIFAFEGEEFVDFNFADGGAIWADRGISGLHCGVDNETYDSERIDEEGGDPFDDGGPFGPGPGGDDDLGPMSDWTVMDGCLSHYEYDEFWCKSSDWDPIHSELIWRQEISGGEYCVYETALSSYVSDMSGQPGVCTYPEYIYQAHPDDTIQHAP